MSTEAAADGSHGILYVCGEKTCGVLTVGQSLLGRKVRRIDGGYGAFVAVVDAWELEWEQNCPSDVALEHEIVSDGLQHVKIQQLAAGKHHRLALTLDGEIYSWGVRDAVFQSGELGQVGNAPRLWKSSSRTSQRLCLSPEDDEVSSRDEMRHGNAICAPRRVHASKDLFFRKVACGRSHAAAVTDKGDLYTWGRNFEGQLGHVAHSLPSERNALLHGICAWPKFVSVFLSKPRVADVSCGDQFTVVLLESGALYSFGERFTGVTKTSETKCDASPRVLMQSGHDGAGFVGIACGFAHALAVTSSGELYAWGWNNSGQLGLGNAAGGAAGTTAVPTRVEALAVAWAKVFAGGNYSAAITAAGRLYTWGVNKHGQLAHGASHRASEHAPRLVDALEHSVVSSVVCCDRNLYAFAPTQIAHISPPCGEITGGYELRIRGSGIWASEDLTVRFAPLTEGRLARGSLGEYNEATQEVVCQVPKFSLAGDFTVEIAANGKHFTTNGHVFSAFKRPQVTHVSIYETRLAGGEDAQIVLDGALPRSCEQPIVRFIPCSCEASDGGSADKMAFTPLTDVSPVDVLATLSSSDESVEAIGNQQVSPRASATRALHFVTPPFASTRELLPCLIEISYNGGLHFVPIAVASAARDDSESDALSSSLCPHIVWYHDAHVQRVRPNSFLMRTLPQTIHIDVSQLRVDCGGVSVTARADRPFKDSDAVRAWASATLKVQSISSDEQPVITCVVPPLHQWEYSEAPIDTGDASASMPSAAAVLSGSASDWWKRMPRAGFAVELSVSMNGGKSVLPFKDNGTRAALYALPAMGNLWNVFPPIGVVSGGTKLSIAGDFFHFDTSDAVVSLQWRDKVFQVPAVCERLSSTPGALSEMTSSERRVVFQTPPLPFPNDRETAAAIAEGLVLGSHEDVDVFVALDGAHFADKSLKFAYCPLPVVLDVAPLEAEPGAKMSLRVDRLVASTHACVRLTSQTLGISTVRTA